MKSRYVKMDINGKIVCSIIVLMSLVYKSSAIECFYCSSANNSACLDMETYDSETVARLIPRVNCESSIPNGQSYNFFCRKIVQTIYQKQMAEVRVMRGCGWVRHPSKDCYKADNRDHLETVCQCFNSYCNAGDHLDPGTMTALFFSLSVLLYFLR